MPYKASQFRSSREVQKGLMSASAGAVAEHRKQDVDAVAGQADEGTKPRSAGSGTTATRVMISMYSSQAAWRSGSFGFHVPAMLKSLRSIPTSTGQHPGDARDQGRHLSGRHSRSRWQAATAIGLRLIGGEPSPFSMTVAQLY